MKCLPLFLILFISVFNTSAQTTHLPFILQDEHKLEAYKQLYKSKHKQAITEIDSLIADANKALTAGTFSVTFHKAKLPPSGDKHDYVSQAPYWWPDSSKTNGKPYIRRDGRINPERNQSKDRGQMGDMSSNVKQLALAYYFTTNEQYGKKAVELMQVWFIDTATRMNPNLNYGQYIPGINDGRGIGIIETVGLTNIPDALAIMQQSKLLTPAFIAGVKQWFKEYTQWLMNSSNGKEERIQINNHGTYYDMQLADFALFTGDKALAQKVIKEQTIPRIDQQFTVDGAQPLELIRTKSWGYSTMNLVGWCKLAVIADKVNIDLWNTTTMDGKGIKRVFEWFTPYMLKEKTWKYEQIEPIGYSSILTIYKLANNKYSNAFQKVINGYPEAKNEKAWW
ncbi:MAG: hypothetical protein JWQ96_2233 [Segetibacter sp.]|nr:hypothetical protein [Segetibacter sp.]